MMRRTTLLSALAMSTLLGACGKHETGTAAAVATPAAAAAAPVARADGAPARLDYWHAVGPLLARSQGGECVRQSERGRRVGSMTIGADGKVSAAGVAVDFRDAGAVKLSRMRLEDGSHTSIATLTFTSSEDGMLSLQPGEDGKMGAMLVRGDVGIGCSALAGDDQLAARPLLPALRGVINDKKQTLSCMDLTNPQSQRDVVVAIDIARGTIKVGDATYDSKLAASEALGFDSGGERLVVGVNMPDNRSASLTYDGAGKLTEFIGMIDAGGLHSCTGK